jgi:Putative MetA-pathway of phenol degradation
MRMLRRFVVVVMVASALVVAPARLAAQNQDRPLTEFLPDLYVGTIINNILDAVILLPPLGISVDVNDLLDQARLRLGTANQIIGLAGNQLSSFPLASASSGFTWTLDTASGAFTRASNSFGPIFAERPLTIGRKRLNAGANFQHVTFDHLEGRSLRGGEIVGYLSVPLPPDDHIFFADSLDLMVKTDTLNAFATYGLTDRLDVGVAVPINRVDVHATLTTRVGLTSSGVIAGIPPSVNSTSGTKTGIGDVVIRAKYNMVKGNTWGIAESIDVRLPTGDELNLLGIGGPQVKLTFITSSRAGRLSPHLNLAYTISGTSEAADDPETYVFPPLEEVNYAAGADLALSLRTTVAVDLVGRVMRKAGTMTWGPTAFGGSQYQQFHRTPGEDLHLLLGSVGLKANPFGNMLFTANVLFPLTKNGLTDRLTWMAGVDYSF